MSGNPNDEGIGLLTGEEAARPAVPKTVAPAATPAAAAPAAPVVPAPRKEIPGLLSLKPADDTVREVTAGTVTTLSAVLTNAHVEPGSIAVAVEIAYTSTYPGEGAEWPVEWLPPGKRHYIELHAKKEKTVVSLAPGASAPFAFQVTAPVGVRYGDRVEIRLAAHWEDESSHPTTLMMSCRARQAVLAIKTARGYEREVADTLLARTEEKADVVFALLVPAALRGYVFAEGMSFEGVREM
ncbi:MAG: hypothetical protein L3J86_00045, partial [Thermoplasmata archaeon]|nr:hypothetical protein [Thermoplasmata archaeon]